MIARVLLARAGVVREVYFALHRVGEQWVPLSEVPDSAVDKALRRCIDNLCAMINELSSQVLDTPGEQAEPDSEMVDLRWRFEVLAEGLRRLLDEAVESDPVQLPENVGYTSAQLGGEADKTTAGKSASRSICGRRRRSDEG